MAPTTILKLDTVTISGMVVTSTAATIVVHPTPKPWREEVPKKSRQVKGLFDGTRDGKKTWER